jgi:predicted  nucleic acid-binding Zn-ribbon protein
MGSTEIIKNAKESVGGFFSSKNTIITLAGLLIISLIFIFYMSSANKTTLDSLKMLQTQNDVLKKNLDTTIELKNKEIKDLEKKVVIYNQELEKQKKKIKQLEEAYANVKPPKDREEIINRFNSYGINAR